MPYRSAAQQRFFHAMAAKGRIPMATVREWDAATDFASLPERVRPKRRRKKYPGFVKAMGHGE